MNLWQWMMVIITGIVCLIVGVILIPVALIILYLTTGITIPVLVFILVECIAIIGIVAVHTWALLKDRVINTIDTPSVVEELKEEMNILKAN
jgi:hypothetical protein